MSSIRAVTLCGLIAALCPLPATAQEVRIAGAEVLGPREAAPPTLAAPQITLSEAVALTIRRSPLISRASLSLLSAEGRHRQLRGLFDPTLLSRPSATFTLQEPTPSLRSLETQKRVTIQRVADQFKALHADLQQLIDGTSTDPPRCPSDITLTPTLQTSAIGRDPTELAVFGVDPNLLSTVIVNLGGASINLSDICQTQVDPLLSPEAFVDVWQRINSVPPDGLGLDEVLLSVSQVLRESRILQSQIAHTVAVRAQLARDRLEDIPTDDLLRNLTFDVSLSKAFRSGLFVDARYEIQSQEHTFIDKSLDPTFGGFGVPPQFYSSASVNLTVPLGKGRGSTSAAAPERAAEQLVLGQREQTRHAVAEEIFRTVLAYLNLIAAQDSARLLAESEARQQELVDVTGQLVTLQTLPQSDVDRVRASAANVATAASRARSAVYDARISLAEAMGVTLESLSQAPIATESFADATDTALAVQALIDEALTARRDSRALGHRRDAASAVAAGARDDMRRRVDVSLTAGISNLYQSPFFRYLPDERGAVIDTRAGLPISSLTGSPVPPLSPVRFTSPRGFGRAISGRYEPFIGASLTVELPFGNNAARGRAAQTEANFRAGTIEAVDLERVIGENILGVTEALERTGRAVARWQEAVSSSQQMHQAEFDRLQIGQSTLIDTLLTEESLTADELQLVRVRQAYLSTLARLRFETGELVTFEDEGTPAEMIRFLSGDFVMR
jgi:outer membrane protein TolC